MKKVCFCQQIKQMERIFGDGSKNDLRESAKIGVQQLLNHFHQRRLQD